MEIWGSNIKTTILVLVMLENLLWAAGSHQPDPAVDEELFGVVLFRSHSGYRACTDAVVLGGGFSIHQQNETLTFEGADDSGLSASAFQAQAIPRWA